MLATGPIITLSAVIVVFFVFRFVQSFQQPGSGEVNEATAVGRKQPEASSQTTPPPLPGIPCKSSRAQPSPAKCMVG